MKKFVAPALAALMLGALAISAAAEGPDMEAAYGTPIVDGKKDNVYVCAPVDINIDEVSGAVATEGATGIGYMAWDEEYLYFYLEVKDQYITPTDEVTSIWSNDSAEFYINLSGEEGPIADINAAQYTYGPNFTQFAGGGLHRELNLENLQVAYDYFDHDGGGWIVEVGIPFGDDYKAKEGAVIPACIGINDEADGDGSTREYHVFTGTDQGAAWSEATSSWNNLTLTGKIYEEPVEAAPEADAPAADTGTAAPETADAGIVAAAAMMAIAAGVVLTKKR